jgi:hypothetical protein
MNKLALIIVGIIVCAGSMFAQGTGNLSVGVGLETAIPMGDFSNVTSLGIGGLAVGTYHVDQNLALNFKAGYLHFSGKDQVVEGQTVSTSYGIVPILVGAKYYFMPPAADNIARFYGAADAGLYFSSASASGTVQGISMSASTSTSDFGVSPIIGAEFKAGDNMDIDVHANYSTIFTSGSSTSWVGIGIGLVFGLGK